jgi:hypothetical protein
MPAKLQVKLFTDGAQPINLESVIPIFHEWIKHHRLNEMMIDVANYAHVPKGPGVALIGNDADYYFDESGGRPGLLYSRKREAPAPEARLADAFRRVITAALLLEKEEVFAGKVRFRSDEILFRINDRLEGPNSETTFAAVRPELDAFCGKLFGGHKLAAVGGPKELFAVKISTDGKTPLAAVLERLGA